MTLDKMCSPNTLMNSKKLEDAKKECSESPSCDMFFHSEEAGSFFGACEVTASIEASSGSILYRKLGNKANRLMLKDILQTFF